jgi:hypothetical protein
MSKLKESTTYESCIGVKEEVQSSTLFDYMELDEEEKGKYSEIEDKEWKKYWTGMPEYNQEDNPPYKTIYIHFRNEEDYQEFAQMIGQTLTEKTKTIWHPALDRTQNSLLRWVVEDENN